MAVETMNITMQMQRSEMIDQLELLAPGRYSTPEKEQIITDIQADPAMDFMDYFEQALSDAGVDQATIDGHISGITVLWFNNAGVELGPPE